VRGLELQRTQVRARVEEDVRHDQRLLPVAAEEADVQLGQRFQNQLLVV
jgi:hypothetical protein